MNPLVRAALLKTVLIYSSFLPDAVTSHALKLLHFDCIKFSQLKLVLVIQRIDKTRKLRVLP